MAATSQAIRSEITIKGSTEIVTEFFGYSINSILYQRGIYPPESFTRTSKYGLPMMITNDEGLNAYLQQVLNQLSDWLIKGEVQKLILVITGTESNQVLERWAFNIETDQEAVIPGTTRDKSTKDIMKEIQAIVRQITASVTFLPLLQEPCTFDLLVHADNEAQVPVAWEESDPKYILKNPTDVKLRSFTTQIHKVDTLVSYRNDDDDV